MVHRAPDSRLLSSLSSHEQTYHKHLLQLVDVYAQSALSALAAYASAAPPGTARGIMGVAGSLAGADEALRRYAGAVDEWRMKLEEIREAEEDVGRVVRDRDILVTRLIKISKSQKPTRDSFIATISPAFPQEPSASSSSLGSHSPSLISANTKLSAAQAELQACETTLASKEAALDRLRVSAVREGLQRRCKAMVECGWVWGEMGKEGLRALEELEKDKSPEKPLPQPNGQAGSDLSSVGPSQSASQIFSPTGENTSSRPTSPSPQLHIPPAHQISEFAHPPMERRITEENSQDLHDSEPSDEETDERDVQLVENKPFERDPAKKPTVTIAPDAPRDESPQRTKRFGFRPQHNRVNSGSTVSVSQSMPVVMEERERERGRKSSLFGRLFRGSSNAGLSPYGAKEKDGKWKTRTSENLRRGGRGRGDDSDSEPEPSTSTQPAPHRPRFGFRRASEDSYAGGAPAKVNPRPGLGAAHPALGGPGSAQHRPEPKPKLKKRRSRNTLVGEDPGAAGWMSDGGVAGVGARAKKGSVKGRGAAPSPGPSRASTVRSASVTPDSRRMADGHGDVNVTVVRSASTASRATGGNGTLARPVSRGNLARGSMPASKSAGAGASLSRESSVATSTKGARRASGPATWSSGSAPTPFPSAGPSASTSRAQNAHHSTDAGRGVSLMAIVEGAARERRASLSAAQNGGMFLPKASDRAEVILPSAPKPAAAAAAPSVKSSSGPTRPTPVKAQTVGAATGVAAGASLYLPTAPKPQNGSALYLPTAPKLHTDPASKPVATTSEMFLPSAAAYTSSPTTKSGSGSGDGMFLPSASAYSIDHSPPMRASTSEPAKSRHTASTSTSASHPHPHQQPNGHASGSGTKTSDGLMPAHLAAIHTPAHRAIASAIPLKSALRTRSPSPMPAAASTSTPPPAPAPAPVALFVPSAPGPIVLPPTPPPVVASAPPVIPSHPPATNSPKPEPRLAAPSPYDPTRRRSMADSEVSSISSYETGRESFESASEGEGTVDGHEGDGGSSTGTLDAVPPPPPKEPIIVAPTPVNGSTSTLVREVQSASSASPSASNEKSKEKAQEQDDSIAHLAVPGTTEMMHGGSDVSSATASSSGTLQLDSEGRPVLDTDGRPVRRKSVRMSLKPTFSPTPPALDEDDLDAYWSKPRDGGEDDGEDSEERSSEEMVKGGSGGKGGKGREEDRWRDSSDEDETYVRARMALKKLKRRW
ncbi:unnamed protein product [Peniophora sp. CBMAI 1063]|nr:unnamed protein product [Peniophora sp. CBMAI 1063]